MKKILLSFMICVAFSSISQYPRFQIEAFTGIQHVHHHNCQLEDKSIHRGLTMPAGLRFHFNLSRGFTFLPTIQINRMIGNNLIFPSERIIGADLKYSSENWDPFYRLDFNVESGIEWSFDYKSLKLPFFIGTEYRINSLFDWFTRLKAPNLLDYNYLNEYYLVDFTFEIGIAINVSGYPIPKFPVCGGTPVFLYD